MYNLFSSNSEKTVKKNPDSSLVEQYVVEFTLKDKTDTFVLPVKGNCTRIMVTSTSLDDPVSAHFEVCCTSISRTSTRGYYGNENSTRNSLTCKHTDNSLVVCYTHSNETPEISYKAFVIDL